MSPDELKRLEEKFQRQMEEAQRQIDRGGITTSFYNLPPTPDETLEAMLDEERALWKGKGDEYTIGNDRLYNFTSVAEKLGMTPMQVWSVYFLKHVYAVLAYAKSGKEGMEGIEGRLADIAVYAKLGRLIVRQGRG